MRSLQPIHDVSTLSRYLSAMHAYSDAADAVVRQREANRRPTAKQLQLLNDAKLSFLAARRTFIESQLRTILDRYRATYTSYLSCVHALSDAYQNETSPHTDIMTAEQAAFEELELARAALLAALTTREEHRR